MQRSMKRSKDMPADPYGQVLQPRRARLAGAVRRVSSRFYAFFAVYSSAILSSKNALGLGAFMKRR